MILFLVLILVIIFLYINNPNACIKNGGCDNCKTGKGELLTTEKYYTSPNLLIKPSNVYQQVFAKAMEFDKSKTFFEGLNLEMFNSTDSTNIENVFFAPSMCNQIYSLSKPINDSIEKYNSSAKNFIKQLYKIFDKYKPKKYFVLVYIPYYPYGTTLELPPGDITVPEDGSLNKPCIFIEGRNSESRVSHNSNDLMNILFKKYKNLGQLSIIWSDWDSQLEYENSAVTSFSTFLLPDSRRLPLNTSYKYKKSFSDDEFIKGNYILDKIFINSYDPLIVVYNILPTYLKQLQTDFPKVKFQSIDTILKSEKESSALIVHIPTDNYTDNFIEWTQKLVEKVLPDYISLEFFIPDGDGLVEFYDGFLHIPLYTYDFKVQLFSANYKDTVLYDKTLIREQLFRINVCQRDLGYFDSYIEKNTVNNN